MKKIAERQQLDFESLQKEVVGADQPVVIRSLFADWPAVRSCGSSAAATCDYLKSLGHDTPVYTIAAPPQAQGRFFYSDDLTGVNFKRGQIPLHQVLTQLLEFADDPAPFSIAIQALAIRDSLPEFEKENSTQLLDAAIAPTMWIGNRGRVAPHFDVHRNLACVVAGRREFIVFPPKQITNLYLGPVLGAPGGVPISLVDAWDPDLERYPRFSDAIAVAQSATLEPGDALYIPSLWWHGVASLESVNVLVNYWWGGIAENGISPNDSLLHGMLAIAGLDDSQRNAWRDFFDHYVFRTGDSPAAHLPSGIEDIVTSLSAEQARDLRDLLSRRLQPGEEPDGL